MSMSIIIVMILVFRRSQYCSEVSYGRLYVVEDEVSDDAVSAIEDSVS